MPEPSAPVFDLQTLSTHDGPGFRTVVFLQGCPLRCTWCCNPEGQEARPYMRWRGHLCSGCLRCVAACPVGAAASVPEAPEPRKATPRPRGRRPAFNRTACAGCSTFDCLEACQEGALELTGRVRSASEVLGILRRDLRLYRNSGGGVTFSGGEPLVHAAFVRAVAEPLRALGVSVALETCGAWNAGSPDVQAALKACDCIFFDLKTLDPALHAQFTGYPLEGILANLEVLTADPSRRPRVVLSLPLISGVSDSLAHVEAVADLAGRSGLRRLRLLPYHRLALGKYEALGLPYPHKPWDVPLPPELPRQARRHLESRGFEVAL